MAIDAPGPTGPVPATTGLPATPMAAIVPAQRALELFDHLDSDGDGRLSHHELKDALKVSAATGRDAATIATLIGDRHEIGGLVSDGPGISRLDLVRLAGGGADKAITETTDDFARADFRAGHITRELFPLGLASVTPAAVKQGLIGDCYFLSAVAAEAAVHPQALHDMIQPNKDGSFTVKFATRSVTVPPLTDVAYARGAGTPQGSWVTVLEAAYNILEPNAEAGGLTGGIRALTGKHSTILPLVGLTGKDRIRETIAEAQAAGRLMTVSRTWTTTGKETYDLHGGHVFSVMGYDPKTDEVIVRDPHGREGPAADGCHRFKTAEFRRLFDLLAVQRP